MEEKQHIGKLFDRIAAHYDGLNHLLSLNIDKRWRRKAVRGMRHHQEVLDVAIGTADFAIELIREGRAQAVTGLDLSPEMMKIGQTKAEGLPIRFVEGSALQMPFAEGAFDAVTCSFGCRNFSDLDRGLREFHRVLRPDGELCVLEFSYPANPFARWVYDLYFSHILPAIGGWVSHDRAAYRYLNRSVKNFVWGEALAERLRQAGFKAVTYQPLSFGIATVYRATK